MERGEGMTTVILSSAIFEFVTSTVLLFSLLLLSTLFLWKKKKMLLKLWISVLGSGIVTLILKFLIQRARPVVPEYFFGTIPDYSFPSLHTALAFATIPFFWKTSPKRKYLFFLLACIIAISRIYFQEHYVSDVVGGAILGFVVSILVIRFWKT